MTSYMSLHSRIKEPLDNKWHKAIKKPPEVPSQPIEPQASSQIDPQDFDIKTDPAGCSSSIEFLLSTLVSKMLLKPNQALALLSDSNKLLIHVIIKGLKGDHGPVIEWYKELFTYCGYLFGLLESEPEGPSATLQVLDIMKAGLYSKSLEVSNWALRLLAKTASEMNVKGMSGMAWDWFVAENGGLQAVLNCIGKNKELMGENVVSVLCQFGRYNFMELFTHNMRVLVQEAKDYMELMTELVQPLAEYKLSRDELVNGGIVAYWIDLACQKADMDNPNIQERAAGLNLLVEIWLSFHSAVEEKAEYADLIIRLLQRANRDRNTNIQVVSVIILFKLLETFALERNPYAPVIYKTLTFALVENHQKTALRELVLSNFKTILETFNTIPVSILMDPFIKQIRTSDGVTFAFNLFDFEFLTTVARHPKLNIKNAIQTLDLLAKPYIYSQIFAACAIGPFMIIANRFRSNPAFGSFMHNLIKVFLCSY